MRHPRLLFTLFIVPVFAIFALLISQNLVKSFASDVSPFGANKEASNPLSVIVLRPRSEMSFSDRKIDFVAPSEKEVKRYLNREEPYFSNAYRAARFRRFRRLLIEAGVPFEPNVLLQSNWRQQIKNYSEYIASKGNFLAESVESGGAIIADTVVLPSSVRFTGDTVILANRVLFEGTKLEIKSRGKAIALFSVNPPEGSKNPIRPDAASNYLPQQNKGQLLQSYLKNFTPSEKKLISIDVSGFGARDWSYAAAKNLLPRDFFIVEGFCDGVSNCDPDKNGLPGRDGVDGAPGLPGNRGADSPDPVDGSCVLSGNPNGRDTPNAQNGQPGLPGGNAPNPDNFLYGATAGTDGGNVFCDIPDGDNPSSYVFTAMGGNGGNGGFGGPGGNGGDGGDGKRGGDGVTCGRTVGNGGKGGDGGNGGRGGDGGRGGNGAPGGNGGSVSVTIPAGTSCSIISADVSGGVGGGGGPGGNFGLPGRGGNGARGGLPGPNIDQTIFGNYGMPGLPGNWGDWASAGATGSRASSGSRGISTCSVRPSNGGGEPPPCFSLPENLVNGNQFCECTQYWWVEYRSDDGGETWYLYDYWYAGCW